MSGYKVPPQTLPEYLTPICDLFWMCTYTQLWYNTSYFHCQRRVCSFILIFTYALLIITYVSWGEGPKMYIFKNQFCSHSIHWHACTHTHTHTHTHSCPAPLPYLVTWLSVRRKRVSAEDVPTGRASKLLGSWIFQKISQNFLYSTVSFSFTNLTSRFPLRKHFLPVQKLRRAGDLWTIKFHIKGFQFKFCILKVFPNDFLIWKSRRNWIVLSFLNHFERMLPSQFTLITWCQIKTSG